MAKSDSRWSQWYGFFGDFYMQGDDSLDWYLIEKKQTLHERTKEEVEWIIRLTHLTQWSTLLDCPCGYGRHSIELAKKGIIVTGSDINTVHLTKAQERALQQNMHINRRHENMIDIQYHDEFDAVINMFYSFGFFDTDEENEAVLKKFYEALKKNGKFLMHTDVNIPRILSGKYRQDESRQLKNGSVLRIIDVYNPQTKRIEWSWIIRDENWKEETKSYSVRVYSREEFVDLCKKIWFTNVDVYSNWAWDAYSPDAEDMIVIATK